MFKKRDMPRTFCIEKYSIGIIGVLLSFFMLLIVILAEIVFLATNNWKAPTALFVIFGII